MAKTDIDIPRLIPCPFCGSNMVRIHFSKGYAVHCNKCHARGAVGKTRYQAAVDWNQRAPVYNKDWKRQ